MKIVLRADASQTTGTGHVMRCLTLARTLQKRSHEPILLINPHGISWLSDEVDRSGLTVVIAQEKRLEAEIILGLEPDLVVVDSYWINAAEISALDSEVPVVAMVDGDDRGIECSLYIDQNLGSENLWAGKLSGKILAGSRFALIREEITSLQRSNGGVFQNDIPNVLIFAGGTDATGIIPKILSAVDKVKLEFVMTVIAADDSVDTALNLKHPTTFTSSTSQFESLLGQADLVIAAAGTSSWEICTLAIPSIFLAVVENQLQVISAIESSQCGEVVNLTGNKIGLVSKIPEKLDGLLTHQDLRNSFSVNCAKHFDGKGSVRVAEALESLTLK